MVMKMHFTKSKPSIIAYRSYKKSDFGEPECRIISTHQRNNDTCVLIIKLFINTEISKAIMIRSIMRYRFLKHKKDEYRHLFQKQRSKCVSLLRKGKKKYFSSLIINKIVDNKSFWEIVQPFLSNKTISF